MSPQLINLVLLVPAIFLIFQGTAFIRIKKLAKEDPPDAKKADPLARFGAIGFTALGVLIALFALAGLILGRSLLLPLVITFAALLAVMTIVFLALSTKSGKK